MSKPKVVVAITHQLTWFWTQTCLAALQAHLGPYRDRFDFEVVVVDNGWDHSPSIRAVTGTRLGEGVRVLNNESPVKTHSTALDLAFRASRPLDYFLPLDSDCVVLKGGWLDEFLNRMRPTDFGVGAVHGEGGVCCSFALYRGAAVQAMADSSAANPSRHFRWGEGFQSAEAIPEGHEGVLQGPFSDRRGFPAGTVLAETPTGQLKGPGHYEPGQFFHHWALHAGHTCAYVPSKTVRDDRRGIPLATFYGIDPADPVTYEECAKACWAVHFWAGTRALDFLNPRGGDLTDRAIVENIDFWLNREAHWWLQTVPQDVQARTLELIKEHGLGGTGRPDARPDSLHRIRAWYREGGIPLE